MTEDFLLSPQTRSTIVGCSTSPSGFWRGPDRNDDEHETISTNSAQGGGPRSRGRLIEGRSRGEAIAALLKCPAMYGSGAAEEIVGKAISGRREEVLLGDVGL
jgi:hypothetical protein